jgi:hypothetical protein
MGAEVASVAATVSSCAAMSGTGLAGCVNAAVLERNNSPFALKTVDEPVGHDFGRESTELIASAERRRMVSGMG